MLCALLNMALCGLNMVFFQQILALFSNQGMPSSPSLVFLQTLFAGDTRAKSSDRKAVN